MKSARLVQDWVVLTLVVALCWTSAVQAGRPDWQRQEVNWRLTGGGSIKAIHYPGGNSLPLLTKQGGCRAGPMSKKILPGKSAAGPVSFSVESAAPVIATIIDSPPINGFVAWVAVAVTDERLGELEIDAVPEPSVVGNYLTPTPETDYAIGIFDTGAGAHIIGNADAVRAGLFSHWPSLITSSTVELQGVIGSVNAWVSQPIGLFIDGLGAIEPDGLILDDSWMVGETNVSVCVGDEVESPNLPTVVGTPLSVYFAAVIYNDQQVTIVRDGNEFAGPDVFFYESSDPCVPDFDNVIPLELRPTGGVSVQYFPNIFDPEDPEWGAPMSPSVISSFLPTQSLFFVSSVDLTNGTKSAIDKDGFMLDTGAQVSVVSEAIAARLGLNPNNPDFEVEILDVTGEAEMKPGFYIDSLEITATPEWLSFTNVPVIMLDVASPEGGTLDGIIGMNLFTEFNLVLRSGGLPDQGGHRLEFEHIPCGDCFPCNHPDYTDWVSMGSPQCWCYKRQCHGDADGKKEGGSKTGYYYVHFNDLNTLIAGWNVREPAPPPIPSGPGIVTVTAPNGVPCVCADFGHDQEGGLKSGYYRVHFNDLNILIANWNISEPSLPPIPSGPGIPPDCFENP